LNTDLAVRYDRSGPFGDTTTYVPGNAPPGSTNPTVVAQTMMPGMPWMPGMPHSYYVGSTDMLDDMDFDGKYTSWGNHYLLWESSDYESIWLLDLTKPGVNLSPSSFSATIDWGDGTAHSTGTVVPVSPPGMPGTNTASVQGSHTYQSPGMYPVTVWIA